MEFKDFSSASPKIKGLFKAVQTLSIALTSHCQNKTINWKKFKFIFCIIQRNIKYGS